MSNAEKENRINSLAVTFLERQQIVPNLYADQIIRGYKEGYHQAKKDLELTWKDIMKIETLCFKVDIRCDLEARYQEVLKQFKEMKK